MPVDDAFWNALDELVITSEIVIDRPKGAQHPRYSDMVYPADYGYLQGTTSMDGGGIDIWRGSDTRGQIDAIICIVDLLKRDSEIKILMDCTDDEKRVIYRFHNESEHMKGILINRY